LSGALNVKPVLTLAEIGEKLRPRLEEEGHWAQDEVDHKNLNGSERWRANS
jgi:hypothetical protein